MSSKESIYTIKKSLKKKLHIKNILDIYFSIYSMKIFVEYISSYIMDITMEQIPSTISITSKKKFTLFTIQYKDNIYKSIIYWLLYEKHKSSKLSFFPKIQYIDNLQYIITRNVGYIFLYSLGLNISKRKMETIIQKVYKQIDFKNIISYLDKHHTPNLFDECGHNKYSIIEKDISKDIGYIYKLYKKGSLENIIPIEFTFTGYSIHNTKQETPVIMPVSFTLTPSQKKLLQKRYIGPKDQFEKAVYTLLLYYSMYFEFETLHIPSIEHINTKKLYTKSVELLGTPLSVPENMEYCGMFPEIEMYFGSKGSFFSSDIQSGTYSLYLPDTIFMCDFVFDSMYNWLNTRKSLTFLLWVPNIYTPDKNKYYKYKISYTNTEILRKRYIYVYSNE